MGSNKATHRFPPGLEKSGSTNKRCVETSRNEGIHVWPKRRNCIRRSEFSRRKQQWFGKTRATILIRTIGEPRFWTGEPQAKKSPLFFSGLAHYPLPQCVSYCRPLWFEISARCPVASTKALYFIPVVLLQASPSDKSVQRHEHFS